MRHLFILLIAAALFTSCDKCKDVTCNNDGVCVDGTCDCATGFSGVACDIEDVCASGSLVCQNDGVCVNGACDCEKGFSGTECEDEDKCITRDVECQNGGTCVDGDCECLPGYYGDECQFTNATGDRDKFVGNFTVTENCTTGADTYSSTIQAATSSTQVLINNFWGVFVNPVVGTIDGSTITIAQQDPDSDGWYAEGSGTYDTNADEISLTFTITDPDLNEDYCTAVYVKI